MSHSHHPGETHSVPTGTADSTLRRSGRSRIRWGALVRALLALWLTSLTGQWALSLARFQEPVRYASLICLALALGLGIYGIWSLWKWLRTLTWQRALVIAIVVYLASVFIVGLLTPSDGNPARAWLRAAVEVPRSVAVGVAERAVTVVRYPGMFYFAYTGQASQFRVHGADDFPEEPVRAHSSSGTTIQLPREKPSTAEVSTGDRVTVTARAASVCQMHDLADGPFASGAEVSVVEGPRFVGQAIWWRVKNASGAGWCPGSVLIKAP